MPPLEPWAIAGHGRHARDVNPPILWPRVDPKMSLWAPPMQEPSTPTAVGLCKFAAVSLCGVGGAVGSLRVRGRVKVAVTLVDSELCWLPRAVSVLTNIPTALCADAAGVLTQGWWLQVTIREGTRVGCETEASFVLRAHGQPCHAPTWTTESRGQFSPSPV